MMYFAIENDKPLYSGPD